MNTSPDRTPRISPDNRTGAEDAPRLPPAAETAVRAAAAAALPAPKVSCQPDVARQWFEKARKAPQDKYAAYYWVMGLQTDPSNLEAHRGFLLTARKLADAGQKMPKEALSLADAKGALGQYLRALLDFSVAQDKSTLALAAAAKAAELNLFEQALFLAERAMGTLRISQERNKAPLYCKLADIFEGCGALDLAFRAAEAAQHADPNNHEIRVRAKNLAALNCMQQNPIKADRPGSFQDNLLNGAAQQQLQAEGRMAKDPAALDLAVEKTKKAWEQTPKDKKTLDEYIQSLRSRNKEGDLDIAIHVLESASELTGERSHHLAANDIRIQLKQRQLAAARDSFSADRANENLPGEIEKLAGELLELQLKAAEEKHRFNPKDRDAVLGLAKIYFEAGRVEQCIPLLQQIQNDPKCGTEAALWLGKSFIEIKQFDIAVHVLRRAAAKGDKTEGAAQDGIALDVRAALAEGLFKKADVSRDVGSAREAQAAATAVLAEDYTYKGMLELSHEIQLLMESL